MPCSTMVRHRLFLVTAWPLAKYSILRYHNNVKVISYIEAPVFRYSATYTRNPPDPGLATVKSI